MDGLGNALKFNDEIEVDFPEGGEFASDGEYIETGTEPTFEYLFPKVFEMVENPSVLERKTIFIGETIADANSLNNCGYPSIALKDEVFNSKECWKELVKPIQNVEVYLIQGTYTKSKERIAFLKKLLRTKNTVKVIYLCRCWQDMPEEAGIAQFFTSSDNLNRFPEIMKKAEVCRTEDQKLEAFNLVRGSEVEMKEIQWLWYPFIPRGKVSMLAGDGGGGKTWLSLWIAAQVTQQRSFPEQEKPAKAGNGVVVYFSAEDDYPDTILPRFQAMGGNLDKFYFLGSDDVIEDFSSPNIKYTVEKYKPDLIVFDAVSSYIGEKVDMNKANKVRGGVRKVKEVIDGTSTAVVLIAHNNKMSSETNAQYRVSGSQDFTAFVRSAMTVARNPEDKDEIVMAQFKSNNSRCGKSFGFKIEDNGSGKPALEFLKTMDITANELLGGGGSKVPTQKRSSPALDEAKEVIQQILEDSERGYMRAAAIMDTLKNDYGISVKTAHSARQQIGVKTDKRKVEGLRGAVNYWRLPDVTLPENPDIEQMGFEEIDP